MIRTPRRTHVGLTAAALFLLAAPRAAAQCTDDYLEPNDTCSQPTLVFGGFSASLVSLYQDDDYFQIHVGAGEELTVDLAFSHSTGDLDLYLFDTGCANALAWSTSTTDDESLSYTNTSVVGEDLKLQVTMWAPNPDVLCNDYDITFTISTTVACQDDNEVGNQDNDNCGDANLVFPDTVYLNLGVLDNDPDYYKLTVPDSGTLYVDLTFLDVLGDIDMVLYDSSCSTQLAWATSSTDDESLSWVNTSGAPMEVKWNVYLYSGTCNQYHMVASIDTLPCGPDDAFEDNDVCVLAAPLGPGTYPSLVVASADPDFFAFQVLQGERIDLEAFFLHANGDVDLRLWDACGGNLVSASTSTTDYEHVTWSNTNGPDTNLFLEVELYTPSGVPPGCNVYDLVASIEPIQPGANYCASLPNSSGFPAIMSAYGSASVGANDLELVAEPLPHGQNGIFYYGPNQVQQPFGDGFRCVGGQVYRLPILNSGPGGVLSFPIDYTNLPPAGPIVPGSTWNFQAWFRDPAAGGAGFNLSDGYHVQFLP